MWFLLGIALLIGGLLTVRWFVQADPASLARVVRALAIVIGGVAIVWLAVSGRLAFAFMLLGALLPMIMRLRALRQMWRNAQGPAAGQRSEVGSRFLRMTLDHDTGAMAGVIVDGPLRGRALDELSEDEQIETLRAWRVEDADSAALLEAWLDRTRPEWRTDGRAGAGDGADPGQAGGQEGGRRGGGPMTRDEAYRVLGLEPGAGPAEIRAAHRSLMQKLHPDMGGSTWIAARVNEAKDLLLGD
ncbi:MAG: DnaJ domain-containing protein [Alphaproteobacteria bacterium]